MERLLDPSVSRTGLWKPSADQRCALCRHRRQYVATHLILDDSGSGSDQPVIVAVAHRPGRSPPSPTTKFTLVFPVRLSRPPTHAWPVPSRDLLSALPTAVAAVAFSHLDAADHLRFGRCSRSLRAVSLLPASMAPVMTICVAAPVSYWNKLRGVPSQHLTLCVKVPDAPDGYGRGQLDARHSAGAAVAALTLALGRVETDEVVAFSMRVVPLSYPHPKTPPSQPPTLASLPSPTPPPTTTTVEPEAASETKTVRIPGSKQRLLPRLALLGFWRESMSSLANLPARAVDIRPCGTHDWTPAYARRVWAQLDSAPHIESLCYPSLPLPPPTVKSWFGDAGVCPRLRTLAIFCLSCFASDAAVLTRAVTDLSLTGPLNDGNSPAPILAALATAPLARLLLHDPARVVTDALWNSVPLAATLRTLELEHVPYMDSVVKGVSHLTALVRLRLGQDAGYPLGTQHIVRDWRGLETLHRLETLDIAAVCVPEPCRTCSNGGEEARLLLPYMPALIEFRAPADTSFDALWTDADPRTRTVVFPRLERLHWSAPYPRPYPLTDRPETATADEVKFSIVVSDSAGDGGGGGGGDRDDESFLVLRLLALAKLPPHARLRELHTGTHAMRVDHVCAFAGRWRARFPALERVVGERHRLELATLDTDYRLGGGDGRGRRRRDHISLGEAPPPPRSSSSSAAASLSR